MRTTTFASSLAPVAVFFVAAVFAAAVPAARAQSPVPEVIPYDGLLKLDGVPADGALAMRFTLYDSAGATLWTEERSDEDGRSCAAACQVPFYRGRFSVRLGEHASLPDTVWSERALLLGIAVRRTDGVWVELAGRQAIVPTPYAVWTTGAADLAVKGDLSVLDDLRTTGTVTVQDALLRVTSAVTAGTVEAGFLDVTSTTTSNAGVVVTGAAATLSGNLYGARFGFLDSATYGDGGIALASSAGGFTLDPDGDFPGATEFGGDLAVDGDLSVSGWVEMASGSSLVSGTTTLNADRGLFVLKHIDMGSATSVDTGIPTAQYDCWIAGWAFGPGDINESRSDIWKLYLRKSSASSTSGNWTLVADFTSHSDEDEEHDVGIICAQTEIMDVNSTFTN